MNGYLFWLQRCGLCFNLCFAVVSLKIYIITAGIKKYKSIIKKKKKKYNKILLLAKLNTMQVLIFWVLIDSYISHDEFVSINNVLRERW